MDPLKIPNTEFNYLFDAHMSLAKECVQVFQASEGFTLSTYPERDEFYEKYLTFFDTLVDEVRNRKQLSIDQIHIIENVSNHLNALVDSHELNYTHLLKAYLQIVHIYDSKMEDNETFSNSMHAPITVVHLYGYPNLQMDGRFQFPFISNRGYVGMNTFLYLHFNDLLPVGITLDPFPVHDNMYSGNASDTILHDAEHNIDIMEGYTKTYEFNRSKYIKMTPEIDKYTVKEIRTILLLMWVIEHETRETGYKLDQLIAKYASLDEPRNYFVMVFETFLVENGDNTIQLLIDNGILNTDVPRDLELLPNICSYDTEFDRLVTDYYRELHEYVKARI